MIDKEKLQFVDDPKAAHPLGFVCSKCLHWFKIAADGGACRRYPPQLNLSPGTMLGSAMWPLTGAADWCGEYIDLGTEDLREASEYADLTDR